MKVDDLQYYEKVNNLEERVKKLESYHSVKSIKIEFKNKTLDGYDSSWNGDTCNALNGHYRMLITTDPADYSIENLKVNVTEKSIKVEGSLKKITSLVTYKNEKYVEIFANNSGFSGQGTISVSDLSGNIISNELTVSGANIWAQVS